MLNANISDHFVASYTISIAWYHNGTKIVSGNKYVIENTTLRINNMAENDTGKYELKIDSISYIFDNGPNCDSLVLPLLEATAGHAPVTFTVQEQEQYAPVYDPSSIVSTHYVANDDYSIRRVELISAPLNSLFGSVSNYLYKNGARISTGGNQEELSLTYNNTATVIGDYVRVLWSRPDSILRRHCRSYYYYLNHNFYPTPLQVSFWSIKHFSELNPASNSPSGSVPTFVLQALHHRWCYILESPS